MNAASATKALGLDRYDRDSRLRPALLMLLPVFLTAAVWSPALWTTAGALSGLLVLCGATFFLSRLARSLGRRQEAALEGRLGARPTTVLLRWRHGRLDAPTKRRYRAFLESRGLELATEDEEAADPAAADAGYASAARWLLEQTRDQGRFPLLLDENIDYGFRRNLLGLKPAALVILTACLAGSAALTYQAWRREPSEALSGAALAVFLLVVGLTWLFVVNRRFVEDSSWSYASRLWAACDVLSATEPNQSLGGQAGKKKS